MNAGNNPDINIVDSVKIATAEAGLKKNAGKSDAEETFDWKFRVIRPI